MGIADPTNLHALDEIKFQTNLHRSSRSWSTRTSSSRAIEQCARTADAQRRSPASTTPRAWTTWSSERGDEEATSDSGIDANGDDDAPVVKFVNKVLVDAISRGASDIHFEPYETDYRVRLRMDGMLRAVATPPVKLDAAHLRRA